MVVVTVEEEEEEEEMLAKERGRVTDNRVREKGKET